MTALAAHIGIGDLAARSGVATSALRFYESRGLIQETGFIRVQMGDHGFSSPCNQPGTR